jgi:hypothetical protein
MWDLYLLHEGAYWNRVAPPFTMINDINRQSLKLFEIGQVVHIWGLLRPHSCIVFNR